MLDVAIIGGGLAGVYAANLLQSAGRSVRVFEAKKRLGGRIHSVELHAGSARLDLGPTWYWPHQPRMQALVAELGLVQMPQYVTGDALYELGVGNVVRQGDGQGMLSYRLEGGLAQLIDKLLAPLPSATIELDAAVCGVERNSDCWTLTLNGPGAQQQISAQHLFVAVAPRIVVAKLNGAQWLPESLLSALAATPTWMAAQAKFVAAYDLPFWRSQGLSGDAFSRVGPMVEVHDACATENAGCALFGFVGVPAVERAAFSREELAGACMEQLERIFGASAQRARAVIVQDWATDTDICTPADIAERVAAHPSLRLDPWQAQLEQSELSFVATEYATAEAGYLEGALTAVDAAVSQYLRCH